MTKKTPRPPRFETLEDRLAPALRPTLLADLTPGPDSSTIGEVGIAGGSGYFSTTQGGQIALRRTDGSGLAVDPVKTFDAAATPAPRGYVSFNGATFFALGGQLWTTDGTEAGTTLVKDVVAESTIDNLTVSGSTLYFTAGRHEAGTDVALWKSDGSADGTVAVKPLGSLPRLVDLNGTLLASVTSSSSGEGLLLRSDGTEDGTLTLKTFDAGATPAGVVLLGDRLFFRASGDGAAEAGELWSSDGTADGTVLIKDVGARAAVGAFSDLIVHDDRLAFLVQPAVERSEGVSRGIAAEVLKRRVELQRHDGLLRAPGRSSVARRPAGLRSGRGPDSSYWPGSEIGRELRTSRKPESLYAADGALLLRSAARQCRPWLLQPPPRRTRTAPSAKAVHSQTLPCRS